MAAAAKLVRSDRTAIELAVRDLSPRGARLIGRARAVAGERVRVVLELDGVAHDVIAEVTRTDPQRAEVEVAFLHLPASAATAIDRSIRTSLERVRAADQPAVVAFGLSPEPRAALERDLAKLDRATRPCSTLLETVSALGDPGARCEAVVVASSAGAEVVTGLLDHLAQYHPRLRRVLLFGDQLASLDHAAARRVDAVLRTPWRIRALARAVGIESADNTLGLLALTID
jgi:hypothetical protein